MFVQTIVIVGAMLVLLMIISTLGGSMNRREKFIEGDDDAEDAGISGEIIRRVGPQEGGSSASVDSGGESGEAGGESDSGDGGGAYDGGGASGSESESGADYGSSAEENDGDDGGDASGGGMIPETKGLPVSEEGPGESSDVLEAFDGDMWAAY